MNLAPGFLRLRGVLATVEDVHSKHGIYKPAVTKARRKVMKRAWSFLGEL